MKSDSYEKRLWQIITPMLSYFVVALVVSFGCMMAFSMQIAPEYDVSTPQGMNDAVEKVMEMTMKNGLIITGVMGLAVLPILISMFRKDSRRLFPMTPCQNPLAYVWPAVLGMSSCLMLNALLSVSGLAELLGEGYEENAKLIFTAPVWLQYVVSAVIAPVMEELIFRGLIFRRMRTYSIFPLAALVSAALFGLYHLNLLQFIYATLLGLLLAYSYEVYHTLLAPIIVHAAANAFSTVLGNNEAINYLLGGNETSMIVSTIICSVITLVCLAFMAKIKTPVEPQELVAGNGEM